MAYTRRLAATTIDTANVWLEVFRAPAEGTVVIRDIVMTTTNVTGGQVYVAMRSLAPARVVTILNVPSLKAGTLHTDLRQVLAPGEALDVFAAFLSVHVAVTGYVFES